MVLMTTDDETRPRRVLIVEDDDGLRNLILKALRKAGYEADGVVTGADALDRVKVDPGWALLLDQKLPDMAGSDIIKSLNERGLQIPFIVMTGQGDERLAVEMMKLGAADYLVKTLDLVDLLPGVFQRLFRELENERRLRAAEARLRESEERFKLSMEATKDGLWDWNIKTDETYFSPGYYRMLGYEVGAFPEAGNAWKDLIHPDDREHALQANIDCIEGHRDLFDVEFRMKAKNGDWHWILGRGKCIARNEQGRALRLVGTHVDITERKQAEAEKGKLAAQNSQLQKYESLTRMAGAIAHHFNNQLGAVIGNLELAIDELPKGAATAKRLTKTMQSAWKAADMSGLMLTYLGQSHDKQEPLDISDTCRRCLTLLQDTMPENVTMETDFPSAGTVINTRLDYTQQILNNLITNAREAIGDGRGTISLSVKTVSPVEIPTVHRHPIDWQPQDKAYACLEVADTGCGIEDKDIEQLFDPFFSTKFTGRGMGLAVVLGLANSHKGVVTVESKPGRGSTFRIFFPMSEEALTQSQKTETNSNATVSSPSPRKMQETGKVLVVEDDAMLRDMTEAMLESFGFTVLKAKDGIEALEIFRQHQSEIKFVLTDLTMPRMGGWETLTAMRKLQPDIPVILSSGYDKAHVMEGDHPELPQAFLAKPYNLKALHNAVSQMLESKK